MAFMFNISSTILVENNYTIIGNGIRFWRIDIHIYRLLSGHKISQSSEDSAFSERCILRRYGTDLFAIFKHLTSSSHKEFELARNRSLQ